MATQEQTTLHDMRKQVDVVIQAIGQLKEMVEFKKAGREISLAYTHAQETKMWLGQALGIMGSELPPEFADKAK